ncbi:hypothetical protein CCAJJPOJ_00223 [Lelliottia sp. T2.26D-8]|nr:hypothetical protein CCAJJPOJ_00223 [Lelliottia sp. T2.26D-8]
MNVFWAIWIPVNIMFWIGCAAGVREPTAMHFKVAFGFSMVTGVLPLLVYKIIYSWSNHGITQPHTR